VIFKVLPDARIKWKDVRAGAVTTAILFMLGKFAISYLYRKKQCGQYFWCCRFIGNIITLGILFFYYCVYFGAEFTKAYAIEYGEPIHSTMTTLVTNQTG
jgi:membrane protein